MAPVNKPSSPSTVGRKRRALVAQHVKKFFIAVLSKLSTILAWVVRPARKLWYGAEVEKPKVIIHHRSFRRALRKCAIHFVPIAVAVVLAGLNIGTYFIGDEFQGYDTGYWQDFDRLALQVTAKLYELFMIASLATSMMDILRHELLSSASGLPLGILAAKTQFVDASFLISPEFRHGISGIDKMSKRCFLAVFIATCSILALLVGPSSALLLIPQSYDDWPAGGATFYLVGANESIWPSQLDAQSIGGAKCQSPSDSDLSLQQLNMSSCVWSGYESISQWFQSAHLAGNLETILVQDGEVERNIILRYYSLSAAAYGVTLAPCLFAEYMGELWRDALFNAGNANPKSLSKFGHLRYRKRGGSTISMNSTLPVVRTTCFTNDSVTFPDMINETYYPLQIEYPSKYLASLTASGQPYDISAVLGMQYSFNATTYANSSRIAAIWLETPADEPIGTQINGESVIGRSSAYLSVQIPYPNSTTGGLHAACSIDARWVQSNILGSPVGQVGSDVTYQAPYFALHDPGVFPAVDDGKWRTVRLGIEWLNILTPELANIKNWNTLSSILNDIGIDNNTGLVNDLSEVGSIVASVVSTVVADGMSRSGYEKNGGIGDSTESQEPLKYFPWSDSYCDLIKGTYVLPIGDYDENVTEKTKIYWSVAVTGLGYRADSVAYDLALAVLFLYSAITFGHITWVFATHKLDNSTTWRSSTVWSSLMDLIVLALRSTPTGSALDNASAGVERFRTFQEPVRIRTTNIQALDGGAIAQAVATTGSDEVEVIIGKDFLPDKHKTVAIGQPY